MSSFSIAAPRCEYRENPLGIDVLRPRLSWQMRTSRRGARQGAYRIRAASSESNLLDSPRLLWDSGRVDSDQSLHVPYGGPPLASGQRVYWQVTVWDEAGAQADSTVSWWEMGLLERADWRAWRTQWIGGAWAGGPFTTSPAMYLRKAFTFAGPIARARLYATALGLYECHLNGARVGDDVFTPGWTDYAQRVQYQVYDAGALLRPGVNVLSAIVGDGWAVGHVGWSGRQRYADRPQFLAQLVITYPDGRVETIATDHSWQVSTGPILESDLLMGESYDARREHDDSTRWSPVELLPGTSATLVATNGPTVRRQAELRPVAQRAFGDPDRPRWLFDLGQNMVGWVRLRVSGPAGTTVTLRFGEVLNTDGTLYTANLRTARSTDHYTLRGQGQELWEPRFTCHGFRYVELSGFPGDVDADTLTGIVVHSDLPLAGTFECSEPLLNQLQHNIVWGAKGNFVDVPTDCPQRDERLGWMGDAQVFIRTAAFNLDVAAFFTKWLRDVADAQSPEGAYPPVAPNPGVVPLADGGPAWADAGIICGWTIYFCYGDTRLLESHYPSMRRFADFLAATSRDGLRCYPDYTGWRGFGDWLALDGSDERAGATSKELIGTAFFAYSTGLLARIARILGQHEDASHYARLSVQARDAFRARFVLPDGAIEGVTQTAYVLALHFDLLPDELRPAAAAALVRNIRQRDNHLSTGFVGTPYITSVLAEAGYLDTAYALLQQTSWPSWLYPLSQGATTIWERWDGWTQEHGFQDPGMNSFNHYPYGAIGAWLYAVVGGIDLDPEQPAYKHIVMHPRPGGALTFARATYDSPYGMIESEWHRDADRFEWRVVVPPNTTATAWVPAAESAAVLLDGQPAQVAERSRDAAKLELEAGEYRIETRWRSDL